MNVDNHLYCDRCDYNLQIPISHSNPPNSIVTFSSSRGQIIYISLDVSNRLEIERARGYLCSHISHSLFSPSHRHYNLFFNIIYASAHTEREKERALLSSPNTKASADRFCMEILFWSLSLCVNNKKLMLYMVCLISCLYKQQKQQRIHTHSDTARLRFHQRPSYS